MTSRSQGADEGGSNAGPSARCSLLLALITTVLLALNLRIPTTALGPLLPSMVRDTGHGETFLSLLTTIPLALTLVIAPISPRIAARFGRDRTVGFALAGIIVGTIVRSIPGDVPLLAGTALLGCVIAVGTVLAPATIAAEHPGRRGTLTGTYTMALSLGPALALGLTVPMMRGTGLDWRQTLMLWTSCSVIALILWTVRTRFSSPDNVSAPTRQSGARPTSTAGTPGRPVVKDARVWMLALYLGVTSLTFYTTSTWLPTTFVADGLDAGTAGGYASLVNIVAIPFAFLGPVGMRRSLGWALASMSPLIALAGVILLLTSGADGALAIAVLLGIAQGLCLGVSYAQIVEYATSPEHAASVSALASAAGIALAAIGPLAFGFGLETSGSYALPMCGLGAVILVQAGVGLRSGRFAR